MTSAIFVLLSLIAAASACLDTCRFSLCTPSTVSLTAESDVPLTSSICLKGKEIGVTNTGEALVESFFGPFRRISHLDPIGLTQPYSPSFFKAYPITNTSYSGVGHEVPQGNQAQPFLAGRCAALPIQEYQRINRNGVVVKNFELRGAPFEDCVSFVIAA